MRRVLVVLGLVIAIGAAVAVGFALRAQEPTTEPAEAGSPEAGSPESAAAMTQPDGAPSGSLAASAYIATMRAFTRTMGREGLEELEAEIELTENELGVDDPRYHRLLTRYATQLALIDPWEAIAVLERVKGLQEQSLDPRDGRYLTTLLLLASNLEGVGNLAEAQEIIERQVELSSGKRRARALYALAANLDRQGKRDESIDVRRRWLEAAPETGEDREDIEKQRLRLARLLEESGEVRAARLELEKALASRSDRLPADDPDVLVLGERLAALEADEATARDLKRRRLEARIADPDTRTSKRIAKGIQLAEMYAEDGRIDRAEQLLLETRDQERTAAGSYTARAAMELGRLLAEQGREDEAETYYEETESALRAVIASQPTDASGQLAMMTALVVGNAQLGLGEIQRERGDLPGALELSRRGLDHVRELVAPTSPVPIRLLLHVAEIQREASADTEAEALIRDAVARAEHALAPEHEDRVLAEAALRELRENR